MRQEQRGALGAADAPPPGEAEGRPEGTADLRLTVPALAAWAAAAIALTADGRSVALACAGAVALTYVLLAAARRAPGHGGAGPRGHGARAGAAVTVAAALLGACAGAAAGALAGAETRRGPLPELARQYGQAAIEVTVTGDPRAVRPHVRGSARTAPAVVLEAEATRVITAQGTTRVRTPVLLIARQSWLGLLPSTRLRAEGRLAPPSRDGDRIAAVMRVDGQAPPQVVGGPSALQRAAGRLRAGLRAATDGLDPDARALLPGLVVGDTSRVPADLDEAFTATDLTHLLAVSGGNFTVLLVLLIGPPHLASRAERRGLAARLGIPLRLTAVLGGGLALGFVVVCRPEPSVLRAAVCGLITLLALGTGRRRSLLPALAAAVLLLVLYDPWLARSYGFLLSVLATGALLTLAPRWSAALRRRGVPARVAEALAAAGAAQAVCAPVIAVLAARVSLVAVPCNLLAEPAVAPATVLGFAALATAPVALPLAKAFAWTAAWPASWIASVARTGAGLPGAECDWPGALAGGLLLAVITTVAVFAARPVLRRPWACAACALLLLLAVVRPVPLTRAVTGWPPPGWRLVACDVGQGDALALAAGPRTAVVVDAGPEPRAVDRCLQELGVDRVPLLLLSHFHADHVDGLPGVLRGRAVGMIETTALAEPAGQAAFVRREAERARVPVVEAVPGERRHLGELSWEVLWPPPAGTSAVAEDGPNDASVALLVRTGGLTLMLLGDLEPPAQQELWESHPGLRAVDVLKVAHHGSAHQDPHLTRGLRPRLALISAGAGNPYGHPAARTVAALQAQGAAVLRTDTDGPIAVTRTMTAVTGGHRRRSVARCHSRPTCGITDPWTPLASTPTSAASAPPARPPPTRPRSGTCTSAISSRCRSRICPFISGKTSCSTAGLSWTRSCGDAAASATSSTARSHSC
ncbi:ComEC/Rec2 family competence protein [Streptomyces sp. NPDC026206]|uniref:ComEC/Rec2 family competence protein n=1 Tax=Streptomyces sp. NPDC026206 TaxID=3157089 RepID=UPI0033CD2C26